MWNPPNEGIVGFASIVFSTIGGGGVLQSQHV
jgi:hypothetical protein